MHERQCDRSLANEAEIGGKVSTDMVAIPLQRASIFRPTRSPSNNCLAGPRTTATLVLAS